jgi:MFS family permease
MNIFEKGELRLLWPFYLSMLITNIFYILPAFVILYFQDVGLSLTQIGFLFSLQAFTMLLFEVPTGAIADTYGRKFSTILGEIIGGLSFISIYWFHSYPALLIIFAIFGISLTLISGADVAWIVDLLHHKRKKKFVHQFMAKRHSFTSFSLIFAGIIGAFLVKSYGLSIIWLVTGGGIILGSFFKAIGQEHFIRRKQHIIKEFTSLFSHTKKALVYTGKHEFIFLLIVIAGLFTLVLSFAGQITWIPYLSGLGFPDYWFGYLLSITGLSGIFAPLLTKKVVEFTGGYNRYLKFVVLIGGIILLIVGFTNILIFGVALFILFMALGDFYIPVWSTYFQHHVPGKMRATITSFRSMFRSVIVIIGAPLAGFLADTIGPQYTIALAGVIMIPVFIIYSVLQRREANAIN